MQHRLLFIALAGCVGGAGVAPAPSFAAVVDEARGAAPAVPLAEVLRPDVDVARYLVSEKYDGVRAVWDGRELRFRSGRHVPAPAWFLAGLPSEALDGELWLGRGRFDELSGIVRKVQPSDEEWRGIRFVVFELPLASGTFAERSERMKTMVAGSNVPWLLVADQFHVVDRQALMHKLDEVLAAGGEGLMLHRTDSAYVSGRTSDLLKLKPWLDAEATVIGYEPGRGRLAGSTGALKLRTSEGKVFRIGSGLSDSLRRNPPPLGSIVSYRFQELTKDGIPRFPRYWRARDEF